MDAILSLVNEAVAFLSALEIASLLSGAQKIFSNVWCVIGLALIVATLYYYVHRFNCEVEEKIGELKGAAFELVRMMETTLDGTQGKADKLNDVVHRYAVDGQEAIARAFAASVATQPTASAMGMGTQIILPSDLTQAGLSMMEKRLADMGSFGAMNNAVRAGLVVFLMLMDQGNIGSAYINFVEHMKKQRDDGKKALPNFVDLKQFFYLPTHWPKEQEPEELQTRGLTPHQSRVLSTAVKRGRRAVLNVTAYNPPPPDGKEPITVSGENILKSMRRFLYTPGTKVYDHALADGR